MSNQISTAFVQQFTQGVMMLAQQEQSRLRETVLVESGVVGKSVFMDQVGKVSMVQKTTRHGDTPLVNTPHARRRINLARFEAADLIDDADKVRTLNDFQSPYLKNLAMAAGRQIDQIIIDQFFAAAATGETGSGTANFDSNNVVAVNSWAYGTGSGNAGLTISKLIEAKEILLGGEAIQPGEEAYIAASSKQLANLLATTEATSADFNTVKALVRGEIDTFMGFKFIHSEQLPVDANSYRRVPVWAKTGMGLAIGEDIVGRISERGDKSYSTQVFIALDMGASRLEEAKVVEIKCAES